MHQQCPTTSVVQARPSLCHRVCQASPPGQPLQPWGLPGGFMVDEVMAVEGLKIATKELHSD
eukprot:3163976-Pyramimonas_sp.AAC.1